MGDVGEYWNAVKADRKERRERYGIACLACLRLLPKAEPSILLPGQRCRIHSFRDPRPRDWEPPT